MHLATQSCKLEQNSYGTALISRTRSSDAILYCSSVLPLGDMNGNHFIWRQKYNPLETSEFLVNR